MKRAASYIIVFLAGAIAVLCWRLLPELTGARVYSARLPQKHRWLAEAEGFHCEPPRCTGR
jgi:hypothetical protein